MTELPASRSERIKSRIAASQARLRRDGPPPPGNLPDVDPPEKIAGLLGEYPGLTLAAGVGVGLLVGALLPKRTGSKFGRRAAAVAGVATELGLTLGRQALDKAGEGRERIGELGEALGEKATAAPGSGMALARRAVKLALAVR